MSKKKFLFFIVAAVLLLLFFQIDSKLRSFFLQSTNDIKLAYLHALETIERAYFLYTDQARKIQTLQQENQNLQRYKILFTSLQQRLSALKHECNVSMRPLAEARLVESIAYKKFGDWTQMWLAASLEQDTIYGLLKQGYAAGIALQKDRMAIALLNGNPSCSYGVLIGKHALGIAIGEGDNRYMVVKYIPNYEKIQVGDEVVTNGLDTIFPYGIPVGEVMKIWQEGSYKVARVKTYAALEHPRFFWLIKI